MPIYSEGQKSDELGSMIIGGLLGSAVGNKLSDNDGAGAAGRSRRLLGREQAKNRTQNLVKLSAIANKKSARQKARHSGRGEKQNHRIPRTY